jgi:hypothetical protein
MLFWHNRYTLGDSDAPHYLKDEHDSDLDKIIRVLEKEHDAVHVRVVYMYDHSGIGLSLSRDRYPFNCPWDSGILGLIYVTKDSIRQCYGGKRVTQKKLALAEKGMLAEFAEYDAYIRGDVYGWRFEHSDGCYNSCWGYYGYDANKEEMINTAKAEIDWHIRHEFDGHAAYLKRMIRNRVPLSVRDAAPFQDSHAII